MTDFETTQQVVNLRMLEFLHDASGNVAMGTIRDQFDNDGEAADWASTAIANGWIRDDGRLSHSKTLTSSGRAVVETARRDRGDRGLRRRACRSRLLRWVDSKVEGTTATINARDFFLDPPSYFTGDQFTQSEVDDAMEYLVSMKLLRGGVKAWGASYLHLGITYDGQECVTDLDSDVAAFLQRREAAMGTMVHVSGEGNSLALALGENSNASSTLTTMNIEAAVQLASAIREAADVLVLTDQDNSALDDIEQRDDASRVERGLRWIAGYADDSSKAALGTVLGTIALKILGT